MIFPCLKLPTAGGNSDLIKYNPYNRSRIVIVDKEDYERQNASISDTAYIQLLNKNYINNYNCTEPYHYFLSKISGNIISLKNDSVRVDAPQFKSLEDDILIYSESSIADLSEDSILKIAQLVAFVSRKYNLLPKSIIYYFEDIAPGHSRTNGNFEEVIKQACNILEQNDANYVVANNVNGEYKYAEDIRDLDFVPSKFNREISISELSAMTGVSESILINQNPNVRTKFSGNDIKFKTSPSYQSVSAGAMIFTPVTPQTLTTTFLTNVSKVATQLSVQNEELIKQLVDLQKNELLKVSLPTPEGQIIINKMDENIRQINSTMRRHLPEIINNFSMPGYTSATLEFINSTDSSLNKNISFFIAPSGFSSQMSSIKQTNKTMGGWFIMNSGNNPETITISGYMLDSKGCQERHNFVDKYYKNYVEDKKNNYNEYYNDWSVNIVIEGKRYIGYIQGFSHTKSSAQPFIYQYNINYISFENEMTYSPVTSYDMSNLSQQIEQNQLLSSSNVNSSMNLNEGLLKTLTGGE